MGQAQSVGEGVISREEEGRLRAALTAGSAEDVEAMLQAHPGLIYAHTREGLNVWHLAAQSGSAKLVEMVAAAVTEALSNQKQQDRVLAQVNAGFNTVNMAVNAIAAATAAAIPSQMAMPMGRTLDKDAQTRDGRSALMVAIEGGHVEAARVLLSCGADIKKTELRGNSALHLAAWKCDKAAVKLLLEHADATEPPEIPESKRLVNAANLAGLSPLHFAGDVPTICLLLRAHAKLMELSRAEAGSPREHRAPRDPRRIPDGYGKTAYTVAFDLGRSDAAGVLDPTVSLQEAINRAGGGSRRARGAATDAAGESAGTKKASGKAGGEALCLRDVQPDGTIKAAWAVWPSDGASAGASPVPPAAAPPATAPLPRIIPPPPRAGMRTAAAAGTAAGPPSAPKAATAAGAVGAQQAQGKAAPVATADVPLAGSLQQRKPQHDNGGAEAVSSSQQKRGQETGDEEQVSGGQVATAGATDAPSSQHEKGAAAVAAGAAPEEGAAAEQQQQQAPEVEGSAAVAADQGGAPPKRDEPPADLVCPITGEVFVHPVRACDQRCYEREAIEMWLQLGNRSFPGGGARITSTVLTPDTSVQARAAAWREAHP